MFEDEVGYGHENWINQFRSMNKLSDQLRFIVVILNSLDDNLQEMFKQQLIKFETLLSDHQFMRRLNLRDSIIVENPVLYYGRDYGDDDPYRYMADMEKLISEISLDIMACLGYVIKELTNRQVFDISEEM